MTPGLSRRDFVSRAAVLWLGAVPGGALAGCGRRASPPDDGAPLGPLEGALNVYNWSDYISPETLRAFEREFGVRVTYDTYESNEELLAKLQAGAGGYDVVVPSTYAAPALIAQGLALPLRKEHLTNWEHLSPEFLGRPFDPDNRYTVPWQWGVTGLAWRTDLLAEAPASWGVFHDGRLRGKLTMMDDVRDVIGAWLRHRGRSINSRDPAHLAEARADAIRAKPNLKAFISAPVKGQLVAGDVWVAQLWNGDTRQAAREEPRIAFALPREGSTMWIDSLLVPRSAPHRRAAHEFVNYLLRPDVAASVAATTGYGSANRAAMPLIEDPVPYPSPDELSRLELQEDLGRDNALWDRIWTEIKASR